MKEERMALENKLAITDSSELAREEERIGKMKAMRPTKQEKTAMQTHRRFV